MNPNNIKHQFDYTVFENLIIKEFKNFQIENTLKDIDFITGSINKSNSKALKHFSVYFLLRQKAKKDILITDLKDFILKQKKTNKERLINIADGINRQINTWYDKINIEREIRSKNNSKSLKIYCYKLYHEYCKFYKEFLKEYLFFLNRNFDIDIDDSYKQINHGALAQRFENKGDKINSNSKELMTRKEVAKYLKITPRQVINIENAGQINRCATIGARSVRYLRSEIEIYGGKPT